MQFDHKNKWNSQRIRKQIFHTRRGYKHSKPTKSNSAKQNKTEIRDTRIFNKIYLNYINDTLIDASIENQKYLNNYNKVFSLDGTHVHYRQPKSSPTNNINIHSFEAKPATVARILIYAFINSNNNNRHSKLPSELMLLIDGFYGYNKVEEQIFEVYISCIRSGTHLYVQNATNNSKLKFIQTEMQKLAKSNPKPLDITQCAIKSICAVKYNGTYRRVRIEWHCYKKPFFCVELIDYGSRVKISENEIVKLPKHLCLNQIPPLAKKCVLAGISAEREWCIGKPAFIEFGRYWGGIEFTNRYFHKAKNFIRSYCMNENQKVTMKILYDDIKNKEWHIELVVDNVSINQLLAREGLVRMSDKSELYIREYKLDRNVENMWKNVVSNWKNVVSNAWKYQNKLTDTHVKSVNTYFDRIDANIKLAKKDHCNIWCYGDIDYY
eukprot:196037_1